MTMGAADRVQTRSWEAEVFVSLKPAVNDPQGLAVRDGLHMLGYDGVESVRVGRYIRVRLTATDQAEAEGLLAEMCERLLANPVIEQYRFVVRAAPAPELE